MLALKTWVLKFRSQHPPNRLDADLSLSGSEQESLGYARKVWVLTWRRNSTSVEQIEGDRRVKQKPSSRLCASAQAYVFMNICAYTHMGIINKHINKINKIRWRMIDEEMNIVFSMCSCGNIQTCTYTNNTHKKVNINNIESST